MSLPASLNPNRAFHGSRRVALPRWIRLVLDKIRSAWRLVRVSRAMTCVMGPQYLVSQDRIEIDITYRCNLRCINCNRSIARAPSGLSLDIGKIHEFVADSISQGRAWRSIRILGGEPTLHPQFHEIVETLREYRRLYAPSCSIEVVSNGHGEEVRRRLALLPKDVWVENSAKSSSVNASFRPFSMAPVDSRLHRFSDFTNGCEIMESCGMGLGPTGYYQCAIAAGIDRVAKLGLGVERLPNLGDPLLPQRCGTCRLCGRFKDGHYVEPDLRAPLTVEMVSRSWSDIYRNWDGDR